MTADVKSVVWSHISTPPLRLQACIGKLYLYFVLLQTIWGLCSAVVKARRYYSDGPGIDSRFCHWIFQ